MLKEFIARRAFLSRLAALAGGLSLSDRLALGLKSVQQTPGVGGVTTAGANKHLAKSDVALRSSANGHLKIVTMANIQPEYAKRIASYAPGIEIVKAGSDDLMQKIVDAEVFYGSPTPKLLEVAKRLKWVQVGSAGVENYVFPEMVQSDIVLTNSSGAYGPQISEHAIGLILALTRGINRFVAQRAWHVDNLKPVDVSGMTMGIVGLGNIGSEIARRAHYGFDMKVLAIDPKSTLRRPGFVAELHYPSWLMEMVPQVDFLVSSAPLTRETKGMFNTNVFNAMKPSAYFINVSRGKLVDTPALVKALEEKRIAGAGLDVVDQEPLPSSSQLWKLPNVIVTGHTSGVCQNSERRRMEVFSENVRRYVAGEPLMNVIDKEKGY